MQAYIKSVGGEPDQRFQRIYFSDQETVWQGVIEALKSYPIDISNRETGVVQTRWKDNTAEANLSDNFGGSPVYLKAQFRYRVNIVEGAYQGRPAIRVSVRKEQLVNQDALDGWRRVPSNGVEERTLLYRLGRIVLMRMQFAREEEIRIQREIEESKRSLSKEFDFGDSQSSSSPALQDDFDFSFEVDDFEDSDFSPL